jgi:RNA polymerase sigma-70 factor, ECF subfamily
MQTLRPDQPGSISQGIATFHGLDNIDTLVRDHWSALLNYVSSSLKDKDLARTITQDSFMRAFNARAHFRGECSVRTWLIKIATNLIRDHTRTQRFQFWKTVGATAIDVSEMHDRVASHQLSPEANLLLRERVGRVWEAMALLSKKQKEICLMRFAAEMDLAEIASATGANLNTVKAHLRRGMMAIRSELRQSGRASTKPANDARRRRFSESTRVRVNGRLDVPEKC